MTIGYQQVGPKLSKGFRKYFHRPGEWSVNSPKGKQSSGCLQYLQALVGEQISRIENYCTPTGMTELNSIDRPQKVLIGM